MNRALLIVLVLQLGAFSLCGCGNNEAANKGDIIAYVNKEPVFDSDLKREIALKARQDPTFKVTPDAKAEQLDNIINRKLIIQKAIEKGLAREEKFVNTIKSYWEQTLIRDFIEYKKKNLKEYLFVTDDEVKAYYNNLSQRVTFKVLRSTNKKFIDDAYDKFLKSADEASIPWQAVGPVGYDEINSRVLAEAFVLPLGEIKKYEDFPEYYLILVAGKEARAIEALETLRQDIEKRVLEMKEQNLFDDWLKQAKEKAKIKIIGK